MKQLDLEIEALRARARLQMGRSDISAVAALDDMSDAMRLMEELRIYQTELEIQNQDLKSAQLQTEAAMQKYKRLFEHLPLESMLVDPQGFIVEANAAARARFGLHQNTALQRRSVYQVFSMDSRSTVHAALASNAPLVHATHCQLAGQDQTSEVDGHILTLDPELQQDSQRLLVLVDRSQERARLLAQQKADAAHALLQTLALHVPGVLFQFQLFPDGRACFPYASQHTEDLYEVTPAQAAQNADCVFARVHPQDRKRLQQSIARSAARLSPWTLEYRVLLPRQGERWRSGVASPQRMADGSTLWHGFASDITEHKQAEKVQNEFNRDFGSFLDKTSDFVYFKNRAGMMRFCSQSLADVFGYANWRELVGKQDRELFPREAALAFEQEEAAVFAQGRPRLNQVNAYQDKQGREGFVQTSRWPLFNEQGEVESIFGIGRDVTESRQAQARIQLAANVFSHAREGIVITDAGGAIVNVNEAFSRITGYSHDEALGNNPRMLGSGRQNAEFYNAMWRAIDETGHWSGEIWNRRKSGEVYAEILTISAVRDGEQQVKHYVALFTDITPMKEHQRQLEHIAHYDQLTGLPNRLLFADRLSQAMRLSERRKRSLSVIYLDLDGFKAVNDSYGHDTGDALLVVLAQRMKLALRDGDSLARFGGDEFVAVLVDLEQPHDCVPVLERLLLAAAEPVHLSFNAKPVALRVSASIGATIYPKDGADADLLMRHADQAMYLAKQAGKNRYHLFDVAHDTAVKSQREGLENMRRALAGNELRLYYQPKVDMRDGAVVGTEALIRWQHPQRGLLAPAEFLPLIENHALSVQVGEWVMETALQQLASWGAQGLKLPVSVNVGALQMQQPGFSEGLSALLARYPAVAPQDLELEILESSALQDIAVVGQLLQTCRSSGVRFALDDFGTGYSSLTYLKHLPAETLKIDQSFVRDMVSDPDDLAIVNGVIGLARAFGRKVIAEGVETAEQSALLLSLGCHCMQGYGIARPMPAEELPGWLLRWQSDPRLSSL